MNTIFWQETDLKTSVNGCRSMLKFFLRKGYERFTVNGQALSLEENVPEDNAWFRDSTRCH